MFVRSVCFCFATRMDKLFNVSLSGMHSWNDLTLSRCVDQDIDLFVNVDSTKSATTALHGLNMLVRFVGHVNRNAVVPVTFHHDLTLLCEKQNDCEFVSDVLATLLKYVETTDDLENYVASKMHRQIWNKPINSYISQNICDGTGTISICAMQQQLHVVSHSDCATTIDNIVRDRIRFKDNDGEYVVLVNSCFHNIVFIEPEYVMLNSKSILFRKERHLCVHKQIGITLPSESVESVFCCLKKATDEFVKKDFAERIVDFVIQYVSCSVAGDQVKEMKRMESMLKSNLEKFERCLELVSSYLFECSDTDKNEIHLKRDLELLKKMIRSDLTDDGRLHFEIVENLFRTKWFYVEKEFIGQSDSCVKVRSANIKCWGFANHKESKLLMNCIKCRFNTLDNSRFSKQATTKFFGTVMSDKKFRIIQSQQMNTRVQPNKGKTCSTWNKDTLLQILKWSSDSTVRQSVADKNRTHICSLIFDNMLRNGLIMQIG